MFLLYNVSSLHNCLLMYLLLLYTMIICCLQLSCSLWIWKVYKYFTSTSPFPHLFSFNIILYWQCVEYIFWLVDWLIDWLNVMLQLHYYCSRFLPCSFLCRYTQLNQTWICSFIHIFSHFYVGSMSMLCLSPPCLVISSPSQFFHDAGYSLLLPSSFPYPLHTHRYHYFTHYILCFIFQTDHSVHAAHTTRCGSGEC